MQETLICLKDTFTKQKQEPYPTQADQNTKTDSQKTDLLHIHKKKNYMQEFKCRRIFL